MWTQLLEVGRERPNGARPKEDLMEMCKIHSQDVLRSGGLELLTVDEIDQVIENNCENDAEGNIVISEFSQAVARAMDDKGCSQDDIETYFGTKRYVEPVRTENLPSWHTEITLHKEAKCVYNITLEPSMQKQASFKGRIYVQLLGVVESEDGGLPTVRIEAHFGTRCPLCLTRGRSYVAQVVAGRFLPMVDDPSWFSSEEAQAQERTEEKAPKVYLHKGKPLTFEYPSMTSLGELTCCRIWHDHKKDGWHLHKVGVQVKGGEDDPWYVFGSFVGNRFVQIGAQCL